MVLARHMPFLQNIHFVSRSVFSVINNEVVFFNQAKHPAWIRTDLLCDLHPLKLINLVSFDLEQIDKPSEPQTDTCRRSRAFVPYAVEAFYISVTNGTASL